MGTRHLLAVFGLDDCIMGGWIYSRCFRCADLQSQSSALISSLQGHHYIRFDHAGEREEADGGN